MMLILNVLFVLIAVAIIALVLMQRGAGAQAGSGFGAGASGTVFGARGASNFLSKSTKWLAVAFFAIALFMEWRAAHGARPAQQVNLGVMTEQPAAPQGAGGLPASAIPAPAATQGSPSTVPAPAGAEPAQPQPQQPAPPVPAQGQ
ncbi:preprotein translocase subunit SecG [Pseudoxanthomonas sangjuensis]|uniref:preprotein translocase subunit SecG n=1 Tax=Pseudoxanthomonas sangjuensis TaxID=1503750 RepID=UPI0013907796|nr:preprotein translocase subunit SecG [Pseudoxanthomonas sangjuensis]KAF1715019.1 preprotein translocase subunit SecG [Pseudoxanthomonas sangjuensis]